MKLKTCDVCQEQAHKYRCPKCNLRYCSLSCYKAHKEACCTNSATPDSAQEQGVSAAAATSTITVNTIDSATAIVNTSVDSAAATVNTISTATHVLHTVNDGHMDETEEEGEDEDDENAEDKVPHTKLDLLGSSAALRVQLENNHLRELIHGLDSHHAPGEHIVSLMQEPLFTEFVNECLKVVEPHSNHALHQINNDAG